MQQHSDFYLFASSFWWLVFPIGWGLAGLVRALLRHREAQNALETLKSYAAQNREPPPELVQILKSPVKAPPSPQERARWSLIAGLFFVALSVAFLVLRATHVGGDSTDTQGAMLFVVVLMAGFAAALFIAALLFARDARPQKP